MENLLGLDIEHVALTKDDLVIAAQHYGARNSHEFAGCAPGTIRFRGFVGKYIPAEKHFFGVYAFARELPQDPDAEPRAFACGAEPFDFNALPGMSPIADTAENHEDPENAESQCSA